MPLDDGLIRGLKDLAEGRVEPQAWLAWWDEHSPQIEAGVNRGSFLRAKPLREGRSGPNDSVQGSVDGACRILDAHGVPYVRSSRYEAGAREEFAAFCAAQKARKAALAKEYTPVLNALQQEFPVFARYLKRHVERIEHLSPGLAEAEVQELEQQLGTPLPEAYRRWLRCCRTLSIGALTFGPEHPFVVAAAGESLPCEGMLCVGDFFLEADGDQVLFDLRAGVAADPPVLYYAHAGPRVRQIAPSFGAWVERLPRSPTVRD